MIAISIDRFSHFININQQIRFLTPISLDTESLIDSGDKPMFQP